MSFIRRVQFSLFLVSATVLGFQIIATRIASVIFVNHFAYLILSLAILGLGIGGILSYSLFSRYPKQFQNLPENRQKSIISLLLLFCGVTLSLFVLGVSFLGSIVNGVVFFSLLTIPFIVAGAFYAFIFKQFASDSFTIYAFDLAGAALGSILILFIIPFWGPQSGIAVFSILLLLAGLEFGGLLSSSFLLRGAQTLLAAALILLTLKKSSDIFPPIPIGNFPEKDFHHVYDDPLIRSEIIDSRWSIFGRSDLVRHSHQDLVRHIFVDGAAGTHMYRFNGNIRNPDRILVDQLMRFSSTLPLALLKPEEKNNMLVIGPGGGKEILAGLIFGMRNLTGVEINPDFVNIVIDNDAFTGGIYTRFPQVEIEVQEGRQFVRRSHGTYDVITMVLPSTRQVQSVENHALSENYLLTVEAVREYIEKLTPGGRLVFTVYNEAELLRLILTVTESFGRLGVGPEEVSNHIAIIEDPRSPTLVVKRTRFLPEESLRYLQFMEQIPEGYPTFTWIPYTSDIPETTVNSLIRELGNTSGSLSRFASDYPFNINPVHDDSPYFYRLEKGLPADLKQLFIFVFGLNLLLIIIPLATTRLKRKSVLPKSRILNMLRFSILGAGFMLVEVSLFQKLILYLGSPTVSLSILLCSLLLGMGMGSRWGAKFFTPGQSRPFQLLIGSIVVTGSLLIFALPWVLEILLSQTVVLRALVSFLMMLPLAFLLGIPFPTLIKALESEEDSKQIPWLYGINGTMSVLGSVSAVILSILAGFTTAFFAGIVLYLFLLFIPGTKA